MMGCLPSCCHEWKKIQITPLPAESRQWCNHMWKLFLLIAWLWVNTRSFASGWGIESDYQVIVAVFPGRYAPGKAMDMLETLRF